MTNQVKEKEEEEAEKEVAVRKIQPIRKVSTFDENPENLHFSSFYSSSFYFYDY